MNRSFKTLGLPILLGMSLSLKTFGSQVCTDSLTPTVQRISALQASLGLDSSNLETLKALVDSDVTVIKDLSDADMRNYLLGVIKGASFEELRPYLFRIWSRAQESQQDIEIKKLLNNPQIISLLKDSTMEFQKQMTRKQKVAFKLSKLWVQLKALPRSLKKAKALIKSEMAPGRLDAKLFDFYGYLNLRLEASRVRAWNKVQGGFGAVQAAQVVDMDPTAFAKIAMMAAEIEEPIGPYSDNSGETFRVVSPQASRFMGKTLEEALAHQQKIDAGEEANYCTNSWCFEEKRHEGAFVNMAKNIVAYSMPMTAPFDAYHGLDPFNPKDAFFHMISRSSTEWNAGSSYFFLGSHTKGQLSDWMVNVREDELKHQSIFIGLYKYIFGDTPWQRLKGIVSKALMEIREKGTSIYGDSFSTEGVSVIELLYSHIIYEKEISAFMKTLPLKTLRKIYETEINLQPLASAEIAPDKAEKLATLIPQETKMRKTLARWPKEQRKRYASLEEFEKTHNDEIMKIISDKFQNFAGAEDYENSAHQSYLKMIEDFNQADLQQSYGLTFNKLELSQLKTSLKETLRDYQIMNNVNVRAAGLNVFLESALTGFQIARDQVYEALKKVKE